VPHRPADHTTRPQIQNDGQVQPAFVRGDVGDVARPHAIRRSDRIDRKPATQQLFGDRLGVESLTAGPLIATRSADQADYDQLQQALAEIHVLLRIVAHPWARGTTIANAAAIGAGAPDVEALVRTAGLELAVEVKSPRIREWRNKMGTGIEAVGRAMPLGKLEIDTYPKDNAVKDAVASADVKFHSLRAAHPDLVGVLVLIWDGLMYQPISALLNPGSGLFTPSTFDPEKRTFDDVDAVLIVPHLSSLIEGPGNREFRFACGTFQWPCKPVPPFVVNPRSPRAAKVADVLRDVFCAEDQATLDGAHYSASDFVIWIDPSRPETP
jgi:hypothetical protein